MVLKLKVVRDEDPQHPRTDFDNLGHMVCWHRQYKLGDEQPKVGQQEWFEDFMAENLDAIILPLYLYDHGGITISTGAFVDKYDSGQVGWIYVTADKLRAEYGDVDANVEACLREEVETYDQFLQGNVWGYVVYEEIACTCCGSVKTEDRDSCFGFYGDDKEGIRQHLPEAACALLDDAWEVR